MNWKTNKGSFLIQKNKVLIPFVSGGVGLAGGERFDEAFEYDEITSSGGVIKKYGGPVPFSFEDEMTVSGIHLVIGDALYEFRWSQQYPYEAILQVKMLLHGLELIEGPAPSGADAPHRPDGRPERAPTRGAEAAPGDMLIPAGKPHRALCDVEVLVYDYDAMGVRTEVLPAGSIFQPWEPLEHWRGKKIPITIGGGATEFDWGVSSSEGHFLEWGDFFNRCRVDEAKTDGPPS
jgi:hypothetical protein